MGDAKSSINIKYHSLDVLRGIAAVWVFASHLSLGYPITNLHPWVAAIIQRGYLGVPMFFVISGYCLLASARASARRKESATSFLRRRWLRIFPPFWCSIALLLALPYLIELLSCLKTGKYVMPVTNFPTSAAEWASILSMFQVFQSQGQGLHEAFGRINSVYWTLAIEVQFYLVVALALACPRRGGVVLCATTVLAAAFALIPSAYSWGVFLPYWPMFALGLGLYAVLERGWTPARLFGSKGTRVSALTLLAVLVGAWAVFATTRFATRGPDTPSLDIFLCALVFAAMLWVGHPLDQVVGRVLAAPGKMVLPLRLLFTIGAMSYSIYLLHTKLTYLVMPFVRQLASPGSAAFYCGCLLGTVILCYPFYLLCEKPFMCGQGTRFRPVPQPQPSDLPARVVLPAAEGTPLGGALIVPERG